MHKSYVSLFAVIVLTLGLGACSSGGGDDAAPQASSCSNDGQKQFVLDAMQDWYLWNSLLPQNVNINDYSTPEALLAFLTTFSPDDGTGAPIDRFSFINTAAADQAFFGEGEFEGFGFSSRFVAAGDLRLSRVFASSPANDAGLARGDRIVELDGRTIAAIEAAEGLSAVFDSPTLQFLMRRPDNSEFTVSITQGLVTINPVPQHRIIPVAGTTGVGYVELSTFISPANAALDAAFEDFRLANVTDVILDLRYNGGGLVSTSELLADFLGGAVAENLLFSETQYNDDRAASNNRSEFFELEGNSISLSNLVVVGTRSTASASELVTNGMEPHVNVSIVGDRTFGKPVGQVGFEFCEKILRPTAFQTVNADGFADYFDGLPADCAVSDDLNIAVGADDDPHVVAALELLSTGACPTASVPGGVSKPQPQPYSIEEMFEGGPAREYLGAF